MTTIKKYTKRYSELVQLPSFEERFNYLKLDGRVCEETFGPERYLNQLFYKSEEWKRVRDEVIARDCGCDLGIPGREIQGPIYIHHMNPIDVTDIEHSSDFLLNPEYLICVSRDTHNAIHYSDISLATANDYVERSPGDTTLWRK
jgi:hypothetical protein